MCEWDTFFYYAIQEFVFVTVEHMQYRTANQLSRYLNKSCILYVRASYNVDFLLMDTEFEPVSDKMLHVAVNMEASRENVG